MMQGVRVLGSGYLAPYGRDDASKLDLSLLQRPLRRGLSEVTKLFMHAAKLALDDAGVDPRGLPVLFASAFGEIAVAEALMAEAFEMDASSPARFRHSVHNTAAGLYSISQQSTIASSAVAGGWATTAKALLEAMAQLALDHERLLLVFAEERVPSSLSVEDDHDALAVAFVLAREHLSASSHSPGTRATLRDLRRSDEPVHHAHPLGPALAIAKMIEDGASGVVAVGDYDDPWSIEVTR